MLQLHLNSAFQSSTPITNRFHDTGSMFFVLFFCCCSYNNNFSMFSMKVLSYGREKCVIMEAVVHDNSCVLANTLAAHFINSSDSSRAASLLNAAKSHLVSCNLSFKLLKCLIVIPFYFPIKLGSVFDKRNKLTYIL